MPTPVALRPLGERGEQQRARSGAEIEDTARTRRAGEMRDRRLDQRLAVRARDQHAGGDAELDRPEGARAGDVSERLARGAAGDQCLRRVAKPERLPSPFVRSEVEGRVPGAAPVARPSTGSGRTAVGGWLERARSSPPSSIASRVAPSACAISSSASSRGVSDVAARRSAALRIAPARSLSRHRPAPQAARPRPPRSARRPARPSGPGGFRGDGGASG